MVNVLQENYTKFQSRVVLPNAELAELLGGCLFCGTSDCICKDKANRRGCPKCGHDPCSCWTK